MRKSRIASLFAVGTAALLATPSAAHAADLSEVPYTMDSSNQAGWWTPLETYVGGHEYAYMAFNEPGSTPGTHKVAIARRDGAGNWSKIPVLNGSSQAEYTDDIGHRQPSMARDGNGYFHVFASMHNNSWRYFRSDTVGGPPHNHSADLPDRGAGITYPVVTTAPNGDVWVAVRVGDNSGSYRSGRLYRWNVATQEWTREAIFAQAPNRSVYPDDIHVDPQGNVHLLFEWSVYPSSGYRHELSYLKYIPSTGAFVDASGVSVAVPATPATADVIQPLEGDESYDDTGGPAVQSAKMTLNGTSPKVAYRYRSPQSGANFEVRYAWVSGGNWSREVAYAGGQTRPAIDITWDPAEYKRIYFAVTSGTDRAYVTRKSGGAWLTESLAPGVPVERLSVERNANGVDVLYLVDVTNHKLLYGRN